MTDRIEGYQYGIYWFRRSPKGRISVLNGASCSNEAELINSWDVVHGNYSDAPKLIRVHSNGEEKQLRPIQEVSNA